MEGKVVLGLDIGTNSVGWALLRANAQKIPTGIIDMGVRIFEESVTGNIDLGKEESKNTERRKKRLIRRQLNRRKRRLARLFHVLQLFELMPKSNNSNDLLRTIDISLYKKFSKILPDSNQRYFSQTLLFRLRAYALDNALDNFELGRIFYHLAQRRGFLSNRKSLTKDDDKSVVKKGISELQKAIDESNSRTLGEYFSKLNPEDENSRIRGKWTSRKMHEDEFDNIWNSQARFNSRLTDELKKELYEIIFFQRPLKSVAGFIGECTLEPGKKRCPWYRFEAQRYRMYSLINNLRIIGHGVSRELTSAERNKLANEMEVIEKISIKDAKNLIGLGKEFRFSIEDGGETRFIGNRTNAQLQKIFGLERWGNFTDLERDMILEDLSSFENEDALAKRGERFWRLDKNKATELAEISLEEGYCNLSRKAINKILPKLIEGWSLKTVEKEIYGKIETDSSQKTMPFPLPEGNDVKNYIKVRVSRRKNPLYISKDLPSIFLSLPVYFSKIRNPIVNRAINQTRKLVNSIIGKYGKPDYIHIEMAREIKNSKKRREAIVKENRENQKNREWARKTIFDQAGIQNPSKEDVLRVLLWDECDGICPYTGKAISINNILGKNSQFDIEHIIPFSRSLDDSFANKTLCYNEENRNVKRNQMPFEAYGNTQKYEEICQRVASFKSKAARSKLYRFQLKDTKEIEGFSERQLNDTRYASREAVKFLSCLYGGEIDSEGTRRIQAVTGGITYFMRSFFGMNNILGDGAKTRDDHRHHAIDAAAIAMTNQQTITWLTENAALRNYIKKNSVKEPKEPYAGFTEELRVKIDNIIASHYISKKVRGSLHKETIYGKSKAKGKVTQRVALSEMNLKKVDMIMDKAVKKAVKDKLCDLGLSDPQKAFASIENLPYLNKGTPEQSVIRKAKIEFSQEVKTIGKDSKSRLVVTGNNHHIEIVSLKDLKGNEKWVGNVVTLIEATQRLGRHEPLVKREWGDDKKFVCSLACGDIIELDHEGKRELFIIRTVPESKQIMYVTCNTAKQKKTLKFEKLWFSMKPDVLRKNNMQKLTVTPLGEIRRAND